MSLEQIVLRISRPSIIPEGKYIKQGNLWKDGRKTEDFYIPFTDWKSKVGSLIKSFTNKSVIPFEDFIEYKVNSVGYKSPLRFIAPPGVSLLIQEYSRLAGLDVEVLWTVACSRVADKGLNGFSKGHVVAWRERLGEKLLEVEKKVSAQYSDKFSKIYNDPNLYWRETGSLSGRGLLEESNLRDKAHSKIISEAGLISSYDKQGNLWALTEKVPLSFKPSYPVKINNLDPTVLHQLHNVSKGIADVYVNNEQIAVTRRVEYGEADEVFVGKWFINLVPYHERNLQELMVTAVAWGNTRKECLDNFITWCLSNGYFS